MATFADVVKAAGTPRSIYVDNATPRGHFGTMTTIDGTVTFYLFEGKKGSEKAIIKGRVELPKPYSYIGATAYKGNEMAGGESLGGLTSFSEVFAKMV